MISKVRRHQLVEDDILDLGAWIGKSNRDAAHRFFDAVEHTVCSLSFLPGRGSPKNLRGQLSNVRSWAVNSFPNHLVLYDLRGNDVYVLAIVHGSRNYVALLRDRMKGI